MPDLILEVLAGVAALVVLIYYAAKNTVTAKDMEGY